MSFDERIGFMLLGMAVGFIAGYIVRALREIKEEVHEVDTIVKERLRKNDDGFMRHPVAADVMMIVALLLVLWSVISAVRATNDAEKSLDRTEQSAKCTQQFLEQTITALNERTTYTQAQIEANVELQKAQADFLSFILKRPPYPEDQRAEAAQKYLDTLNEFVELSNKNVQTIEGNPYPTTHEFQVCLAK